MQLMKSYSVPEVHQSFKLNGYVYTNEELKMAAYGFKKNGELYEQEIGSFLIDWLSELPYMELQTSGSTGIPKKIKVFKAQMVNSALATGTFFKLAEDATALLCLSANYIAGKMMLVRAMVLGWRLDVVPYRVNPLDNVYRRYDFCAMVPLQLDNSLNRLHLIKKLIVGGGSVAAALKNQLQSVKTKVYETYGMTETVSHIAARRLNSNKKTKKERGFFKVLPNITITTDERGCLVIKAPKLCEETVVTNDIVAIHTYKKFEWKGRYDNVVNSGGVKLYPETIEMKLQPLISQRFFVCGIPDDSYGDRLILIIEDRYQERAKERFIMEISRTTTLAKYEIPKEIYFLPKFIETPTGKIQRVKTLALL